jgi:hypothetical protein
LELAPKWEFVADTVMGGVSKGSVVKAVLEGREATRLTGKVSLENNGGFIQMATDLAEGGRVRDASPWIGLELDVTGNGEIYELRLRTDQLSRPWQSFRTEFQAPAGWRTLFFPFSAFEPHRTDVRFDPARLRRIGILAVGREFEADVAVAALRFHGVALSTKR